MRQLRKILSAPEVARRAILRSGLNAKQMSRSAERDIVSLLNQRPSDASKNITQIVEACQRVIELDQQLKLSKSRSASDALLQALVDFNLRVMEYRCFPLIGHKAAHDHCFDVRYVFDAPNLQEAQAVEWIMDNIHVMHRIRRCRRANCIKWFFAVTDHQKYCGDDCRKRDAQQGEAFKERRKQYMKQYRKGEVERGEVAKRLARRKSK